MTQRTGSWLLVLCCLLWSMAGIFIKLIPWHSMVIGSLRSLLAGIVLWLELCRTGHPIPVLSRSTLTTGLMLGCATTTFVVANKLTTAANAIVLQSANPIFVLLFSLMLFGQRFSRRDLTAVAFTIFGIALFFLDELSPGRLIGNLIALSSAVTLAAAFISAAEAKDLPETMSGVMLGHAFSFLVGLPFYFTHPPVLSLVPVVSILILGIFQLGVSYVLFSYAARVCSPLAISLIGMLEPIFNPIWVAIFIHEIPGPLALFGGAVVIVTLLIWGAAGAKQSSASN